MSKLTKLTYVCLNKNKSISRLEEKNIENNSQTSSKLNNYLKNLHLFLQNIVPFQAVNIHTTPAKVKKEVNITVMFLRITIKQYQFTSIFVNKTIKFLKAKKNNS